LKKHYMCIRNKKRRGQDFLGLFSGSFRTCEPQRGTRSRVWPLEPGLGTAADITMQLVKIIVSILAQTYSKCYKLRASTKLQCMRSRIASLLVITKWLPTGEWLLPHSITSICDFLLVPFVPSHTFFILLDAMGSFLLRDGGIFGQAKKT